MRKWVIFAVAGSLFAAGWGATLAVGGASVGQRLLHPPRDVTDYRVVGQGCGKGDQRSQTYIAKEESDLPGPTCEVVFELAESDFE